MLHAHQDGCDNIQNAHHVHAKSQACQHTLDYTPKWTDACHLQRSSEAIVADDHLGGVDDDHLSVVKDYIVSGVR